MTRLTDALERARKGDTAPNEPMAPVDLLDAPASSAPRVDAHRDAAHVAESDDVAYDEPVRHEPAREEPAREEPSREEPALRARANRFADEDADRPSDDLDERMRTDRYHFSKESQAKLVVGPNPDHTLVEQYRHLAAALHHAQLKHGVRTVMITSAVEAEGKTTTAANVALTLSHSHQRRVLLIDADLRRPSVHSIFQLSNRDGLGDYLRDFSPTRRKPSVHQVSPTLSILTAGRPTQDPMSSLVSVEMKQVIDEAAEHFDWVVVDTPPVGLLSDANLLAAMIDVAILVVRANSTAYPLVQRAQEAIGADRILGVVLNRARKADLILGYGYYYYGYSYKPAAQKEQKKGLARFFGRK